MEEKEEEGEGVRGLERGERMLGRSIGQIDTVAIITFIVIIGAQIIIVLAVAMIREIVATVRLSPEMVEGVILTLIPNIIMSLDTHILSHIRLAILLLLPPTLN